MSHCLQEDFRLASPWTTDTRSRNTAYSETHRADPGVILLVMIICEACHPTSRDLCSTYMSCQYNFSYELNVASAGQTLRATDLRKDKASCNMSYKSLYLSCFLISFSLISMAIDCRLQSLHVVVPKPEDLQQPVKFLAPDASMATLKQLDISCPVSHSLGQFWDREANKILQFFQRLMDLAGVLSVPMRLSKTIYRHFGKTELQRLVSSKLEWAQFSRGKRVPVCAFQCQFSGMKIYCSLARVPFSMICHNLEVLHRTNQQALILQVVLLCRTWWACALQQKSNSCLKNLSSTSFNESDSRRILSILILQYLKIK